MNEADISATDIAPSTSPGMDELFNLSLDMMCIATVDGYFKQVNPAFERTLGYSAEELLSRSFFDLIHPDDLERTLNAMESLDRGEELQQFENRYVCRDGSVRWLQWNTRPGPKKGLIAAAARDVTDSRIRKEQAALRRVATLVARNTEPAEVFSTVAVEVAHLLEADYWLIGRYESDSTLTCLAANGPSLVSRIGEKLEIKGNNLPAIILRSGRSASINYDDASGPTAVFAREDGIQRAVGTPILVDDHIWGVMIAGWVQNKEVSTDTEERIAKFTELVASAIANAESHAELVASRARVVDASYETRRRIERDLHDGAQQQLVTLALKLRSLTSTIPIELEELLAGVVDFAADLESVIDELRELSRGIHPAALTRGGLGPALKTLARRAPIPVEVDVKVPSRPHERIEVAIYYIVAESLTNVAKHSQASVAKVNVAVHNGLINISIHDDGVGGANPSLGSGLIGLKDRINALGGTMSLISSRAVGTSIFVQFPLVAQNPVARISD